jgi:hypothetical protein
MEPGTPATGAGPHHNQTPNISTSPKYVATEPYKSHS